MTHGHLAGDGNEPVLPRLSKAPRRRTGPPVWRLVNTSTPLISRTNLAGIKRLGQSSLRQPPVRRSRGLPIVRKAEKSVEPTFWNGDPYSCWNELCSRHRQQTPDHVTFRIGKRVDDIEMMAPFGEGEPRRGPGLG